MMKQKRTYKDCYVLW